MKMNEAKLQGEKEKSSKVVTNISQKDIIEQDDKKEESSHQDTGEQLTMKERKNMLRKVKLKNNCPSDCNLRECTLRNAKKKGKNCKCNMVKQHCYFCYQHICTECSENRDDLETGIRRCKRGECQEDSQEQLDGKDHTSEERKNVELEQKDKKQRTQRGQKSRCGYCITCKQSCENTNKDKNNWCDKCV